MSRHFRIDDKLSDADLAALEKLAARHNDQTVAGLVRRSRIQSVPQFRGSLATFIG